MAQAQDKNRLRVCMEMSPKEKMHVKAYIRGSGRKLGPWIKALVLAEINAEEAFRTGKDPLGLKFCRGKGTKR